MTTVTINIPDNAKAKLTELVKALGGEVISQKRTKEDHLKGVEESLGQVKQIREGKLKALTLEEALGD